MSTAFFKLHQYLNSKMRMSHIYQPVMIRRLLLNEGKALDQSIAEDLSAKDPSQIEYYKDRVNNMVGRVLRKNGIVEKSKNLYSISGIDSLSIEEIRTLIDICEEKIEDFITTRNIDIWDHRNRNRKPIPGSIIHKVFERAKGRCELCGISKDLKHLEVDHIIPKSLGGSDEIHNYQALCYSCNSRKGNRSKVDYRQMNAVYEKRESSCTFCTNSYASAFDKRLVKDNELAYVIFDKFPVTAGHSLIIPKRHFPNYSEVNQAELNAMHHLTMEQREQLMAKDSSITGFNIGINEGVHAGQTIMHCHMHLIPRRQNDQQNPTGGIRRIFPDKADYRNHLQ